MKKSIFTLILGFGLFCVLQPAYASSYSCKLSSDLKAHPLNTKSAVQNFIAEQGYEVRRVKKEHNCFEVYALKDGQRFELYVHPQRMEIVKMDHDD